MLSGISLWGLFEYTNETLFDSITLTERLNKNNLVSHIIDKHGQLDLWQQNPIIVKRKINTFFLINYDNFDKMAEVLQMDYNPLENYDRSESTTENRDTNRSGANQSNTQTSNASAATGESHSTGSNASTIGNYNTEHQVSADNESSYQPLNKDIVSSRSDGGSSSDDMTNTSSATGSANEDISAAHSEVTDDDFTRTSRIHGNIGVTTSQQMLESELEIRKFNIYDYIADLFAAEFLLRVY